MGNRKKKFINVTLSIFMLFTCIHFTGIKATEDEQNVDETPIVENDVNDKTSTEDGNDEQSESDEVTQDDSNDEESKEETQNDSEEEVNDVSNVENSGSVMKTVYRS